MVGAGKSMEFLRPLTRIPLRCVLLVFLIVFIDNSHQQQHQQQQFYKQQAPQQGFPQPHHQVALARGYSTNQNPQGIPVPGPLISQQQPSVGVSAAQGGASCAAGGSSGCSLTGGYDFNPALLGGQRGLPGIRARINSRGFQYFSTILAPILAQQIKRARIPNINQCIPEVSGCIQVYNLYVSRFRCPQRVVLYPAPPNQVVLAVENLDIGVTGNLGGQINIILPIALFGVVQANIHQLSIRVALVVDRGAGGGVGIRVASCQVTVGYVDVYIENGGLVGDIANSQFRGRISDMVRKMLPNQLCGQIPTIVNEQLNGKLTAIPQSISLSQILQTALSSFGISNLLGGGGGASGGQCAASCPKVTKKLSAAPRASSNVFIDPPQSHLMLPSSPQNAHQTQQQLLPRQQQQQHQQQQQQLQQFSKGKSTLDSASNVPKHPNIVLASNSHRKIASSAEQRNLSAKDKPQMVQPQRTATVFLQHDSSPSAKFALEERHRSEPKVQFVSSGSSMKRPTPTRQFFTNMERLNRTSANIDSIDSSVDFDSFRLRRRRQATAHGTPLLLNSNARALVDSAPSQQQYRAAGVAVASRGVGVGSVGGVGVSYGNSPLLPPPPPVAGVQSAPASGGGPSASGATKGQLVFGSPGSNPCGGCPASASGEADSPLAILSTILTSLDFTKLSSIYLTIQFLQGYATTNDYTLDINGEFSPGGAGGTPFGAFPMQFPTAVGDKMAEILISDWTLNTLFYHLHRVGFIMIRVGPDTPKIGDLLKTTCSSDAELEDFGVEADETLRRKRSVESVANLTALTANAAELATRQKRRTDLSSLPEAARVRRQDNAGGGSLSDLGICLGDILPAVREKYPNQKIVINIHTARAPSVVLSARNGGTATLDFVLDADMHIQSTNEKVGTIQVAATVDFTVKTSGGRISAHADITKLELKDVTGSLGLPQDGLDNLGNLGKELLLKAGNDALEKGAPLSLPPNLGGLPLTFVNPQVTIVEHALHLASDFTIDPSALGQLGLGGGGGGGC